MIKKEFRYMEMSGILRTEIMSGFLKPGQFLLPEKELCQVYNISRNSLRQALELLTNEGLLVKMVGRGTMVAQNIDFRKRDKNVLNILCPNHSSFVDKALPILIAMFKEHYPNVDIRQFGSGIRNETLLSELTNFGVNADIVIVRDQDLQRLPLEEYFPLDDIARDHEEIQNKLLQVFRRKHRLYGVPLTYSPVFLACNPQLFAANNLAMPDEEWDMEQFIDLAKQMTLDSNGDGLNDIYGFGLSNSLYRWPVLAMRHGYLLQQNESGHLNLEGLQEVLVFLQKLVYKDRICPIMEVNDWVFLAGLFAEGRLGMILTTTLSTNMRHDQFPVTVIPLPKNVNAVKGSLAIANAMMVPKISGNPDLAKLFARFAMRVDFQQRMVKEAGFLSIYSSVNEEIWTEQELKALGVDADNLEQSHFIHELLHHSNTQHTIEKEMVRFWSGFETPAELIARFKEAVM